MKNFIIKIVDMRRYLKTRCKIDDFFHQNKRPY